MTADSAPRKCTASRIRTAKTGCLPKKSSTASVSSPAGRSPTSGAGTGYFTLPIAARIAPAGRVFAVDVSPEMLARLHEKLAEAALTNVQCVEAEASATTLPPNSCDCVLLANVWHEFDGHAAVLAEARRILRPGAHLAILDWRPDVEPVHGPPLEHRISAASARQALAQAGFTPADSAPLFKFSWLVTAACS